MSETTSTEVVMNAIHQVEHPEIASSLVDLGMVRDIHHDTENNTVQLTLVVPFLGIPQQVRDYMVGSLYHAIKATGAELNKVQLAEMTEEEKQAFFRKEQLYWRS